MTKRFAILAAIVLVLSTSARALAAPSVPARTEGDSLGQLREQGNEAMLGMRYADALGYYQRASTLAPDDVGLHYSLARAHQFLGNYPEALTELELFAKTASRQDLARIGSLEPLFADLRPRVAMLDLRCSVAGARILLRDRVIGTTPVQALRVPAGASTLQVELEGFFTEKRDIVLPPNGALTLDIELHKKSTSSLLLVTSTPIGAQLFLDGHPVGTTSPRVELATSAGPHELVATREGYDKARVPILLSPSATREVAIPLEKSVAITSRWWFWTGLGVIVAGGIVTAVALTTERSPSQGSLGRVAAP